MITLHLLEDSDTIHPDDWCRPLAISLSGNGYGDTYSESCPYTGTPINNLKWVQAKHVLGSVWWGKTVKEFNGSGYSKHHPVETRMEFVRGDIPRTSQLNMKGFNSAARLEEGLVTKRNNNGGLHWFLDDDQD